MPHNNRARKKQAAREQSAPAMTTAGAVTPPVQEQAPDQPKKRLPRELSMREKNRSDYLRTVRSMSGFSWFATVFSGAVLRVVATYLLATFVLRFAVVYASQAAHEQFVTLATDARAVDANVNALMDEYTATTASASAIGAVLGALALVVGWMLFTEAWQALVIRSQGIIDAREVRREERQEKREKARERKEAARAERLSAKHGETTAEDDEAEIEQEAARG